MILQSSLNNPNASMSSALSYSLPFKPVAQNFRPQIVERKRFVRVRCSVAKVQSQGTVDYERRPTANWNVIYKKLSMMKNPELGSQFVLEQCDREGKQLRKWELCRVVKELRKYNKHARALEVYEWMGSRGERFKMSSSDAAIHLDLVGKVRGISGAEKFFLGLSESTKDRRVYGALLHAYVRSKNKEKAESMLDRMRAKGYATHALPFNVMMTLYMNLKEFENAEAMVVEMTEKKIPLDAYTYNIWLACRGAQGSAEGMEEVFAKMRLEETINPNWSTYSTLATLYIKLGSFEKAEEYLRMVESSIAGRNRIPYHYLLSCYGSTGNREEILRVWNVYKAVFPTIPNTGYHAIISSLLRTGDVEAAGEIYEQWLPVKASYDPRIANLFMKHHVKNGNLEKAVKYVEHIVEVGGEPNAGTWEALAVGHLAAGKLPEALSYWKESFAAAGPASWRPWPANVSAFLDLCDREADLESKDVLMAMLKEAGLLTDGRYVSEIGFPQNDPEGSQSDLLLINEL